MSNSRLDLITAMVQRWQTRPAYTVKRGAVNWGLFNFDEFPFAVAIMQDRGDFGELFGKFESGDFTWEIFAKTPEPIDDTLQATLLSDAKGAMRELMQVVNSMGDGIMLHANSYQWVEVSDTARGLQGIVVSFTAKY
jgi:hypothetical protein